MLTTQYCQYKHQLRGKIGQRAVSVIKSFMYKTGGVDGCYKVCGPSENITKWYAIVEVKYGKIYRVV